MSFCSSSHNRGSRKTPSILLQKKEKVREKTERKQKRVAAKFIEPLSEPPSDETCTRTDRLARPTLCQDPRMILEVRF